MVFSMLNLSGTEPWYHSIRNVAALLRLVGIALVPVAAIVGNWWHKRKEKTALNWPAVEGHVQTCSTTPLRNGSYMVTFEYSYFVGEYRAGQYIETFESENEADKFIHMMKNQNVPVRYNPRNPDESLIEEADVEQYIELPPPDRLTPLK